LRAYEDLRAAQRQRPSETIMGLIALYRKSAVYARFRPESKRWVDRHLKAIEAEFGDVSYEAAEHKEFIRDIEEWRDGMAAFPAAADAHVSMLARLLSWGVHREALAVNRAAAVEKIHAEPNYADQLWTLDEIARFRAAAAPHLRRAFDLARLTGLRQSDVVRLTWTAVKGPLIEWATVKSGQRLMAYVPVTGELRAVLEECPRTAVTVLTGAQGFPMAASRLRTEFQDVRAELGVAKRWHDLRGNAATELMAAGMSDREVSVMMAVSEKNVAKWRKRYVADRAIAVAAVERLSDWRTKHAKGAKNAF
jgi:integrase